ncbi:diguanylate cyclase [Terrilactibacillus sp. BCM23-1]|uniref:Diguanylate cyclase n=1 Tax=Terrilactibacillus tamarindi TaxID=2599694 RepID=A0A6N8CSB5_9BACI|nr:sensor domain-containing diguanylate cyclase [Terrilactibacillus tamarindi]MTT30876.1 diguanylate cyclase [Terrilactibacillus tamarindi]
MNFHDSFLNKIIKIENTNQDLETTFPLKPSVFELRENLDPILYEVAQTLKKSIVILIILENDRPYVLSTYGIPKNKLREIDLDIDSHDLPFVISEPIKDMKGRLLGHLLLADPRPSHFSKHDQQTLDIYIKWMASVFKKTIFKKNNDYYQLFTDIVCKSTSLSKKMNDLILLSCQLSGGSGGAIVSFSYDREGIVENAVGPWLKSGDRLNQPFTDYFDLSKDMDHYRFDFGKYDIIGKKLITDKNGLSVLLLYSNEKFTIDSHFINQGMMKFIVDWLKREIKRSLSKRNRIDMVKVYHDLFKTVKDAIIISNQKLTIQFVNKVAKRLFGYKKVDMVGKKLTDIINKNDQSIHKLKQLCENPVHTDHVIEFKAKQRDGTMIWLEMTTYIIKTKRECLFGHVIKDITTQKANQAMIHRLAYFDSLTDLPNRISFNEKVVECLESHQRFGILFIDINGFKEVNDTYGHNMGDQLLKEIGYRLEKLKSQLNFHAYRYGGDEFLVLVNRRLEKINDISRTIKKELSRRYYFINHEISISASIGTSIFPEDGSDILTLLQRADLAMYQAKFSDEN